MALVETEVRGPEVRDGVDRETIETVHAIVILHPGQTLDAKEIVAHCRERIAHYKCPRSVDIRLEPLPLSAAGKVLKRELRVEYLAKVGAK